MAAAGALHGRTACLERNLRDPHARAPVRAAHRAVHARPRDLAGGALRDRARLLRQRAAQSARAALRTAADARGVPRVALDREAVPPLRLLSRERRRRGRRRHDHRAGARPATSSGDHRRGGVGDRSAVRRVRRRDAGLRALPAGRQAPVGAGRMPAAGRRRRPVLRELHRAGLDGAVRDGVRVARRHRGVRLGRPARRSGRRVPVQHQRRQHRRGVHPRVRDDQRVGAPDPRRVHLPGEERRTRARGGRARLLRRAAPCCSERPHEARPRRELGAAGARCAQSRLLHGRRADAAAVQACKHIQHPPEDVCESCQSFELGGFASAGNGSHRERRGGHAGGAPVARRSGAVRHRSGLGRGRARDPGRGQRRRQGTRCGAIGDRVRVVFEEVRDPRTGDVLRIPQWQVVA